MKKILAIVLAFALVLSVGAFAFAATAGDATATEADPTVPDIEDMEADKDTDDDKKILSPGEPDIGILHGKSEDGVPGRLIVKYITGEIRPATPIYAPYGDEGKAAVELADKDVMYKDAAFEALKEETELVEALKVFYAENPDSLQEGVITLGEDAVESGSVTLAVDARGFDKVQFTAPGDAEKLGFVVLYEK